MSEKLLDQGAVFRTATSRKRLYLKRLIADKGYTSRKCRSFLRKHHIAVTIPPKQNEHHKGVFDKVLFRTRNRVERLFARLKQFRRVATWYEKMRRKLLCYDHDCCKYLWSQFAYTPFLKSRKGLKKETFSGKLLAPTPTNTEEGQNGV